MLEAVPNVSEGRDARVLDAVGEAFSRNAILLDVHADADHHRSVFTLVSEDDVVEALVEGVARAVELVDLRDHSGVHPRVGVADVVPVVPLVNESMPQARAAALAVSRRLGTEVGLPVFRYGEIGEGRRPAYFRRGGLPELTRRVSSGELVPDDGPHRIDPRAGAVLVAARAPLVAYNLDLATVDVEVARSIARAVRASSGGVSGVQAIGLLLPESGRVQVSMNIVDVERAPLHVVVERVRHEAALRGTAVRGGELVGLVPEAVVRLARAAAVDLPGIDDSRILETALRSRLER